MTKEEAEKIITKSGYSVISEKRVNDCGYMLKISNGAIINVYDKGTYNIQGKNAEDLRSILDKKDKTQCSNKVFVVYGHDTTARTQLEAMLRRWDLEPIILDQIISSGQTIIEKLEEYTAQVDFGIVLATPDDLGRAKNSTDQKLLSRVRQNVVLELGMLLSSLGRDRVAILLKEETDFERPSDINGLIYIPFKDNVEEAKVSLAKEMKSHNYQIEIANL